MISTIKLLTTSQFQELSVGKKIRIQILKIKILINSLDYPTPAMLRLIEVVNQKTDGLEPHPTPQQQTV